VTDPTGRHARLRYTATGAIAALAAAGAIAGTAALAASPSAKAPACAAAATRAAVKAPGSGVPDKTNAPQPAVDQQPFVNAIQQLVQDGTITPAQGQSIDREIQTGRVDTDTLAAAGFTPTQLQAVQQALANAKRALAASPNGTSK